MELLQQQPSEISLYKDSSKLILKEQTHLTWLTGILIFFAVSGISISAVVAIKGLPSWMTVLILTITFGAEVVTLLSWVITQTYTFDVETNTVTLTQKGLFGKATLDRLPFNEIQTVQLMPKTSNHAWNYYISLKLRSGQRLGIDLTSSETVDREIVRRIRGFMNAASQHTAPGQIGLESLSLQ